MSYPSNYIDNISLSTKQLQLVRILVVSRLASPEANKLQEASITALSDLLDACNEILRFRRAQDELRERHIASQKLRETAPSNPERSAI